MVTARVDGSVLAMSPQGVYVAAGGTSGFQLFYVHGNRPLTALTSVVLPGVSITKIFWDKHEHLYVLSDSTHALYVFNITSSGAKQAAGSPYSIPAPAI